MKFKFLREKTISEIEERYNLNIKTEDELNKKLLYHGKEYKGDFEKKKNKFINFLNKKKEKEINIKLNLIKSIEEAEDFKGELVLTIEWTISRMWGSNPRAYTNYGFIGESIGGCGYCKTSTATAQALNSDLRILKLMYAKKEKTLKNPKEFYIEQNGFKGTSQGHINADILGYGAGYNILPSFEGGVGVSSHERILKGLGLNMRCITDTKSTNVYLIK